MERNGLVDAVLTRLKGVRSDRVVGWIAGRNPELVNEVLDEIDAYDVRRLADPEIWP